MKGIDKTFVLNVKAAADRRRHIEKELGRLGIEFEYIMEGDIPDIDQGTLKKYFAGPNVSEPNLTTSCSLKHILAIEDQWKNGLKRILVLEDDAVLHRDFHKYIDLFIEELEARNLSNYILNIEFGNFLVVPRSKRKKGQYIYPGKKMRCAAAYIVDLDAARSIMDYINDKKCHRMFDIFMDELSKKGIYRLLWSHPPIAEQMSNSGDMVSMINPEKKSDSLARKARYRVLRAFKFLVANFK